MKHFSPVLQDLVNAFKGLPGIGVKSAQRIVFNLIQHNQEKALFLSETIKNALENITECSSCRMYTDSDLCEICSDPNRNSAMLCVIESPADMIAIENSMSFNGRYFVLRDGYYRYYDHNGVKIDEHRSRLLCRVVNDIDYHQTNLYRWKDGKSEKRDFPAEMKDDRLFFKGPIDGWAAKVDFIHGR